MTDPPPGAFTLEDEDAQVDITLVDTPPGPVAQAASEAPPPADDAERAPTASVVLPPPVPAPAEPAPLAADPPQEAPAPVAVPDEGAVMPPSGGIGPGPLQEARTPSASHLVAPAASSAGIRLQSPTEASLLGSLRGSQSGTPRAGGGGTTASTLAAAARARAASAARALRAKDWAGDSRAALNATVAASKEAAGAVASMTKAATIAAEERLRRLRVDGGGAGRPLSSSHPSTALEALCASEAAAVPGVPRVLLVCLAGLVAAAEAGVPCGGAFLSDAAGDELAQFVLSSSEGAAGAALPPPGATPATLASAAKLYCASLPEPVLSPPGVLADFIAAGAAAVAEDGSEGGLAGGSGAAAAAAASRAAASLPPAHATVLHLMVDAAGRLAGAGAGPWDLGAALAPALAWHSPGGAPLSPDETAAVGRAVGCLILRATDGGGASSPHAF